MHRRLLVIATLVAAALMATAQQRPITSTYLLEAGAASVTDTYLSPLRWSGYRFALSGNWSKMMPSDPERLRMVFDASVAYEGVMNPARNSDICAPNLSFSWGMGRVWSLAPAWQLYTGANAGFDLAALYLPKNSNNPVSAHLSASIALCASAEWTTTLLGRRLAIGDKVTLPSLGAFFTPQFGETYYEIYLGNREGLVHPGWWGNNFRLDNLLTATWAVGNNDLTVGYRLRIATEYANYLNYRNISHSVVIGVTCRGTARKNSVNR